jgi:hypothetical protein
VIVKSIVNSWTEFFFKPQRSTPVALYRILYGLLNIANLVLLRPDWFTWYGSHAYMSVETMNRLSPGARLNLFVLFPQTDFAANAFFWVFLACAISLTVGFMSRFSGVAVYLCLMSMHARNPYILNGGDTVLRVTGFYLMFAATGGALSVDRLKRIWTGREGYEPRLYSPWAQRMIQVQMSVAYLSTFGSKMFGKTWRDGTAVYYVLRLEALHRFPVPFVNRLLVTKLITWGTLVIEFAVGFLVWFRALRYAVLIAGFVLHMSIEYSMNLPLFEWIMVATYVTFIDPEDLSRAWVWISKSLGPRLGAMATVVYDGASSSSLRAANTLRALDVCCRLHFVDLRSENGPAIYLTDGGTAGQHRVSFITGSGALEGFSGLCAIAHLVPLLWPLAIPSLFRGHVPQPANAKE